MVVCTGGPPFSVFPGEHWRGLLGSRVAREPWSGSSPPHSAERDEEGGGEAREIAGGSPSKRSRDRSEEIPQNVAQI